MFQGHLKVITAALTTEGIVFPVFVYHVNENIQDVFSWSAFFIQQCICELECSVSFFGDYPITDSFHCPALG